MFELLGICLALAALLSFNAATAAASAALWRIFFAPRTRGWSATARASLLFSLRIFPPTLSLLCVLVLLVPAYVMHEPRTTNEVVGFKLVLLAAVSAAGMALAFWRGLATWLATRRLARDWMRHARAVRLPGVPVPAFTIRHQFPVIAVVGILRPRLFVAEQVFDTLGEEELAAAIAHECGHLRSRDNLKHALMRACRDSLAILPCGSSLDRAWLRESEAAADEHAARAGSAVALDLASALVKVARLVPPGAKPTMPAGVFLIEETEGGMEGRVRCLLHRASGATRPDGRDELLATRFAWLGLCATVMIFAALPAAGPQVLTVTHNLIEYAVTLLK